MRVAQTTAELEHHLKEQVGFLRASMDSYDQGFEGEAKRLAVTIRVLVHDTKSSASLLKSLGVKQTLRYLSYDDPALLTADCIQWVGVGMRPADGGMRYCARTDLPTHRLAFDEWWERVILLNRVQNVCFTCKDAVLNVANQDGGSHVDPGLDETYAKISRQNQFGWNVFIGGAPGAVVNGPELPIVRQTAKELELTLAEHYNF